MKKILFILFIIILLSFSTISEQKKILHIGDQYLADTSYGSTLQKLLKDTGAEVYSYGVAGSTAKNWIDGTKGSYSKFENTLTKTSGSQDFKLQDLKTTHTPNIIIISLGTNYHNIKLDSKIEEEIKNLVAIASKEGTTCYWIGPPQYQVTPSSDESSENIINIVNELPNFVAPCIFIDSIPSSNQDTINTEAGITEWAQNTFEELPLVPNPEAGKNPLSGSETSPSETSSSIDGCLLTPQDSVLLIGASGVAADSYYTQITSKCPAEFDKAADPGKQIGVITELLKQKIAERESSGKKMYTYAFIPLTSNDIASGKSAAELETKLMKAIDYAKTKNIQVITQTLTPFAGYSTWKDKHLDTINELNVWVKDLYTKKQISAYADFNAALTDPSNPMQLNPEYTSDKLHSAKPAGQKKVAEVFIQSFNQAKQTSQPKSSSSIGFNQGTSSGASASQFPPQFLCDNPQRCQNLDEVWAKRISMYINPEIGQKIWTTTHGWRTFEEVYTPPPPPPSSQLTSASSSPTTPFVLIPTGDNCGLAKSGSIEMRALLDTIASGEGRYNNMWCGQKFTDMSTHPYKTDAMPTPNKCTSKGKVISSTAAGRYGFLYKTYTSLKKKGQFQTGFTPKDQDEGAIALIKQKGITQEQLKTALESKEKTKLIPLFDKIAPIWASIPSSAKSGESYYGQRAQSTDKITAYLLSCYDKLKKSS